MTLLYTDPLFLRHETGPHPECPDRLRSITARLNTTGLAPRCTPGVYQPVTEEQVAQLHTPMLVRKAKELAQHGGGRLDPDTVVCPDSFRVALAAAGACASAVDAVLQGADNTALCLVR